MMLNSKFKKLAVIPARGGSKGLSRKNIRLLNSKPMLAYTIECALESSCFDNIIVSTDDDEIAKIAEQYGANIPYLRPDTLATDNASIIEVVLNVLEYFEKKNTTYEAVTLLQPTSPLRNANDICAAMNMFVERNANSIVSVCEAPHSPLLMNTLSENQNLENFLSKDVLNKRRQDLAKYYMLNGAIYIAKTDILKTSRSFYVENSFAYIMPRTRSIDVDDEVDFRYCEAILNDND